MNVDTQKKEMKKYTKENLIRFEKDMVDLYEQGLIQGTIHLSKGNEDELIEIFKKIKPNDWVFTNHRSHYHCILKSHDMGWVGMEILSGNSMHMNSQTHKIFSSSIVGGCLSIAVGTAMAIKRLKKKDRVFVFVGDMAAEMGIFIESMDYASRHNLPITFIIEDNEIAVYTPTQKVWGTAMGTKTDLKEYTYKLGYPHHGIGKWVNF